MTVYMGRRANQRKVPKWPPFKNCMSESLNILYAYVGDICILNIKFLYVNLWLAEVCIDANDDANDSFYV